MKIDGGAHRMARDHVLKSRQRGFSGLEVATAVIILGIVFAMAMKGTALVEAMRAFLAAYQIQNYQYRVFTYQAQFNHLPGDDPMAPRRFNRERSVFMDSGVPVTFNGDLKLDGKLSDALNPLGEQFMAWRDLRYAGMEGDPLVPGASAMPENPFGGVYGFDQGNLGQKNGSLCATRVPGRAAEMIDHRLDDGVIDKGRVVATSRYDAATAANHFDAPDSQPYDVEKEYIICVPLLP
jgi:hypothetical protein